MLRMKGTLYPPFPPQCLHGVRTDNLTFTLIVSRIMYKHF